MSQKFATSSYFDLWVSLCSDKARKRKWRECHGGRGGEAIIRYDYGSNHHKSEYKPYQGYISTDHWNCIPKYPSELN